jgi:choice-of-anchor B domain-containing protein
MRGSRALLCGLVVGLVLVPRVSAHQQEIGDDELGGSDTLAQVDCVDGYADGFPCWNTHLHSWIPLAVFGQGAGNDIWGWTDAESGREVAIMGLRRGVAFVDVTNPHQPVYLGVLPTATQPSAWNDVKIYRDHAFVVSEAPGHGMQILDLHELEDVIDPPVVLEATAHYPGFGNAHNLAIDEATGFAYAVGTHTCGAGLHMLDVRDPQQPLFAGCFSGEGYTHDAQCVVYAGPDPDYQGRELCFNSNEDTLTIVDVTSKVSPQVLARRSYVGVGYTHQGWLSEDHAWFLLGDELDELFRGHRMRTYVWDLRDIDAPRVAGSYTGTRGAIDHNLFVRGNHVFQANYRAGLRVLRMGDLSRAELVEVAYFDTFPEGNGPAFEGAWGVYPFFESGNVAVSDINRGLFLIKPDLAAVAECADGIDNDADGLVDHPDDPGCADAEGARELLRTDVAIDLKPGNASNTLNPSARGVVAVAVLGSEDFDVAAVDPASLAFGPGGTEPRGRTRERDVDGDGFPDLYAHYPLAEAGLEAGVAEACLRWETRDGTPYRGCAALRSVPAGGRSGAPWRRGPIDR